MNGVTHAYIGTKPCGCTVAACVDDPKHADSTADAIADFVRTGYKVERVLIDDIRLRSCTHGRGGQDDLFAAPAAQQEGE